MPNVYVSSTDDRCVVLTDELQPEYSEGRVWRNVYRNRGSNTLELGTVDWSSREDCTNHTTSSICDWITCGPLQVVPRERSTSYRTPTPQWAKTKRYGATRPQDLILYDGSTLAFPGRGIGIEIEIEFARFSMPKRVAFSNAISEHCRVEFKKDASIRRGVEICPQPFESMLAAIERMSGAWRYLPPSVRKAPGPIAAADSMAGTHIHVSGGHPDLPVDWQNYRDVVRGFVGRYWDAFKVLGQFSPRQECYKGPSSGRGWWHSVGWDHVEFRGFGLCRDGVDLANYFAIIKATLWTARVIDEYGSAVRSGLDMELFRRKLVAFGYNDRYDLLKQLPSSRFNHDDFLHHERYLSKPHKRHGLVLGKEEAERRQIARQMHTCAMPPGYVPPRVSQEPDSVDPDAFAWRKVLTLADVCVGDVVRIRPDLDRAGFIAADMQNAGGGDMMAEIRERYRHRLLKVRSVCSWVRLEADGEEIGWVFSSGWLEKRDSLEDKLVNAFKAGLTLDSRALDERHVRDQFAIVSNDCWMFTTTIAQYGGVRLYLMHSSYTPSTMFDRILRLPRLQYATAYALRIGCLILNETGLHGGVSYCNRIMQTVEDFIRRTSAE